MDLTQLIITAITALGASITTYIATRGKTEAEVLVASVSRDEMVLSHYDKMVDQLQEEVSNLRRENEELRLHNFQLERDILEANRSIFEVSKELAVLKEWITENMPR